MSGKLTSQRSNGSDSPGRRPAIWTVAGLASIGLIILIGLSMLWPNSPTSRLLRQDSTWRSINQRGVWRVGLDPSFPPFEALDEAGIPTGYDVDLARALAETWGVEAEVVAIGYDSLLDALMAGKIDSIVSALPYDPRLTKDIAYSEPYFDGGLRLAVPLSSPIETVEDLNGSVVAVEWGSGGDMVGRQLQRDGLDFGLESFPTPEDAIDALTGGGADALLIDNVMLRQAQGAGNAIKPTDTPLESIPYVIAMPHDAYELHRAVSESLNLLENNGMMSLLETEWFGPLPDAGDPPATATKSTE